MKYKIEKRKKFWKDKKKVVAVRGKGFQILRTIEDKNNVSNSRN